MFEAGKRVGKASPVHMLHDGRGMWQIRTVTYATCLWKLSGQLSVTHVRIPLV